MTRDEGWLFRLGLRLRSWRRYDDLGCRFRIYRGGGGNGKRHIFLLGREQSVTLGTGYNRVAHNLGRDCSGGDRSSASTKRRNSTQRRQASHSQGKQSDHFRRVPTLQPWQGRAGISRDYGSGTGPVKKSADRRRRRPIFLGAVARADQLGCYRSHAHVGARSVLDDRQVAAARFARGNALMIQAAHPLVPNGPPGVPMTGCICESLVGGRRQVIVRPMAVLAARCADDSRHVSGGGQNELDGTGI
ncbi:hypothetical protein ABIF62_003839 [Bradyrhizobium japonicum]